MGGIDATERATRRIIRVGSEVEIEGRGERQRDIRDMDMQVGRAFWMKTMNNKYILIRIIREMCLLID